MLRSKGKHRHIAVYRKTHEVLHGFWLQSRRRGRGAGARCPVFGPTPPQAGVADCQRVAPIIDVEQVGCGFVSRRLHFVTFYGRSFRTACLDFKAEIWIVGADDIGLLVVASGPTLAPHSGLYHIQPKKQLALKAATHVGTTHQWRHSAVVVEVCRVEEWVAAFTDRPQSNLTEPVKLKVKRV